MGLLLPCPSPLLKSELLPDGAAHTRRRVTPHQVRQSGQLFRWGSSLGWWYSVATCHSAVCWDPHVYQVHIESIGVRILSSRASGPWDFWLFITATAWGKRRWAQASQWIRVCDTSSLICGNNCFGCNLKLFYYIIFMYEYGIVYLHACLCFYAVVWVWTSMSNFGFGALFLQCETWRSNSGGQIWSQRT